MNLKKKEEAKKYVKNAFLSTKIQLKNFEMWRSSNFADKF